ncbi:vicilin-like seed storage protein At2g18540 [Penaeus chinensis]|uniref:vicilin-like seed storage protein At2g18540 n=1 Tax=Penaeus chinensis TaxID=139456 RepID=UPI001FB79000|nr:vicilin-like seed storage protein At2g18540 [Penaeus chinensis]
MKEDEDQSSRDTPGLAPPPADRTPQRRPPQTSTPWQLPPLANAKPTAKTTSKKKAAKRSRERRKAMPAAPDKIMEEEEEMEVEEEQRKMTKSEDEDDLEEETLDEAEMSLRGPLNINADEDEEGISAKDIEKELVQMKKQQASERSGKESRPHTSHARNPAGVRVTERLDELQATQAKMSEILQEILKKMRISEAKDRAREEEEDRRRREEEEKRREWERKEEEERQRKEEEKERVFVKSRLVDEEEEELEELIPISKSKLKNRSVKKSK